MNNTVRQERLRRGWSQVYLSILTGGISPSDLSAIERGKKIVHPGSRKRISKALGVSPEDLFGEESKDNGVSN